MKEKEDCFLKVKKDYLRFLNKEKIFNTPAFIVDDVGTLPQNSPLVSSYSINGGFTLSYPDISQVFIIPSITEAS